MAVGIGGNGRDERIVDLTGGAVEGERVAFLEDLARKGELLVLLVHLDVAAAGDAAGTHAARDDCRMRRLTAANGEDALRELHAFDVFGRGFQADKHDLFALFALFNGVFGGEYYRACCRAGGCGNTLADHVFLIGFL